jgi:hypothetical protein
MALLRDAFAGRALITMNLAPIDAKATAAAGNRPHLDVERRRLRSVDVGVRSGIEMEHGTPVGWRHYLCRCCACHAALLAEGKLAWAMRHTAEDATPPPGSPPPGVVATSPSSGRPG